MLLPETNGSNDKDWRNKPIELDLTPKDIKRIKIRLAEMPDVIWKCNAYTIWGRYDGQGCIGQIFISLIFSPQLEKSDPDLQRFLILYYSQLVVDECHWIDKDCYRFTFTNHSGEKRRVDFFHNKNQKIDAIYIS
jgi:hypothetical protein